jgi:hypothetical protein
MPSKLAAFKIFRRSVTVAVFRERNLDFVDIQHLSNVPQVALETLDRFAGWIVENFHPKAAALAAEENEDRPRTQMLAEATERKLLERGIPIWKVSDTELLENYAIPRLTQKHELRSIARSMWPYVATQHQAALDAALVGLYIQVERLLSQSLTQKDLDV